MALRRLERRNHGGKSPVSIKYQNLHTFNEGLILLCQNILETRRITHLHGSTHFKIPLNLLQYGVHLWCANILQFSSVSFIHLWHVFLPIEGIHLYQFLLWFLLVCQVLRINSGTVCESLILLLHINQLFLKLSDNEL